MRLYLSSYRLGDRFDELVASLGIGAKVAVVSNAVDTIDRDARLLYARTVFDPVAMFSAHGLRAEELDLRDFFSSASALGTALADVKLVWANGGNAFLLRRALRQSGLDTIITTRVAEGTLAYGGWSAGAVVAGPSLRGFELMDDPHALAESYDSEPVWDGLGLIDLAIVPHFRSDHPEAPAAERVAALFEAQGVGFLPLRDGEAILI